MGQCVVIGSGILGASIAYHLAKAGVDVTIVDRHDCGQATDAGTGIICPWLSERRGRAWHRLTQGGARFYPKLIRALAADGQTDTGFAQVGAIYLHTDATRLKEMEDRAKRRRREAPEMGEIARLSPAETQALFPPLSERYASLHISGGARVDGRLLRDALINAAKRYGASYKQGDARLVHQDRRVTGVTINGERISGEMVILAAGVWANDVLESLGVRMSVRPKKGQIVHLKMPDADTSRWPVVRTPDGPYLLAFDGGRIVVGATHEDEAGYDTRVTAGGMWELLKKALDVAPGLYSSTWLETRVGLRPYTPGALPAVGWLPGYEGLVVANGLGAFGLTVGPYLGSEIAKWVQGQPTELDFSTYDLSKALG
jgi:D-amino-acid dehydrogenase